MHQLLLDIWTSTKHSIISAFDSFDPTVTRMSLIGASNAHIASLLTGLSPATVNSFSHDLSVAHSIPSMSTYGPPVISPIIAAKLTS